MDTPEIATLDRILATPKTDVIPNRSLYPKTIRAERAIMATIVEDHVTAIARSIVASGVGSPNAMGAALSAARMEASFYGLATAALSPLGRLLTVQQSLIDGLGRNAAQEVKASITLEVTEALMEEAGPEKIADFCDWYYHRGAYAPPKEGPVKLPAMP